MLSLSMSYPATLSLMQRHVDNTICISKQRPNLKRAKQAEVEPEKEVAYKETCIRRVWIVED